MQQSRFHGVFGPLLSAMEEQQSAGKVGVVSEEAETLAEETAAPQPQKKKGQIAVDIYEEDGYYIIKAPIAGVKLADLDIDVSENTITIRGSREQCDEVMNDQYFLQECYWGEFSRSVTLPCYINPSKVKATFSKDSILKVYVPKEKKVKIVKINEGG